MSATDFDVLVGYIALMTKRTHMAFVRPPRLTTRAPEDFDAAETECLRGAWIRVVAHMPRNRLQANGRSLLAIYCRAMVIDDDPCDFDPDEIAPAAYPDLLYDLAVKLDAGIAEPEQTPLDCRIGWLGEALDLDGADCMILGVLTRIKHFDEWSDLQSAVADKGSYVREPQIALLAGMSRADVAARLADGSRLFRIGLVENYSDREFGAGDFLMRIVSSHVENMEELAASMMPPAEHSTLEWRDFDHLGPQRELALKLVAANEPASILLYGVPGTGKTEFARLLSQQLGKQPVFAGVADSNGLEPTRGERIAHLTLVRALTRNDPARAIIVDEAEDLLMLDRSSRTRQSKLWLNRLVEEGARPVIWILNDPEILEESILRRMDLAIGFERPSQTVRRRIVARHAQELALPLSEPELAALAALPAAPAVLRSALRGARLAGGGGEEARIIGEGLVTALSGTRALPHQQPAAYDPSLALADQDLEGLASRLAAAPGRGWSLLVAGPSGTGKSAFARHLAERIGIGVVERRASDLLGPYVGMTESNIADAFRESTATEALLLIDEADDFLFDRREGQRSWERAMVAEMLRWMEILRAPFVATTNLADRLDPATQRRFTLRVDFRPLDPGRAAALFERRFGKALPPGQGPLQGQTPGDFAVVAQRAELLGETDTRQLVLWLLEEAGQRAGAARPIGF